MRHSGTSVSPYNASAWKDVESGRLHALRVADASLEREIFVVCDRRRVVPAAARLFLDLLGPVS